MITKIAGFKDPVHETQITFRTLLEAFSQPGKVNQIKVELRSPSSLNIACAAACLTLLDLETQVWLQPGFDREVKTWLLFHTGCRFTEDSQQADFAIVRDLDGMPQLSDFKRGTPGEPQNSTTLLLQIDILTGGDEIILKGPGILAERIISPSVPGSFWQQWQKNTNSYPLGVDLYFLSDRAIIGLPRTSLVSFTNH